MSDTRKRIHDLVSNNDVFLFMKGSPTAPQCGFSAKVVQILDQLGVPYESADVLQDAAIREGVKVYTDWPTIPQLFIKGEFLGGCDIVMEMVKTGELKTLLAENEVACIAS